MKYPIKIQRIYDDTPSKEDGYRILIDRIWPRGIKKENAHIDLWLKDIAPSNELRKWFNHKKPKWLEFKKQYCHELANKKDLLQCIIKTAKTHSVILLYSAKDEKHNNAVALLEYLHAHWLTTH